jgi:hypothetical protein
LNDSGRFSAHALSAVNHTQIHSVAVGGTELVVVSVYPNPTSGFLLVKGIASKANLELLNAGGEKIADYQIFREDFLDLSSFPAGVYFLKVKEAESLTMHKVIIQ